MLVPAEIGDYTDFYASVHHATNVGALFRPDNPLLPNYKWVPIGYHGRASSIVASGTAVRRPAGQLRPDPERAAGVRRRPAGSTTSSSWASSWGRAMRSGSRSRIADAERHIFGVCLVNDWSARDVQAWEYQPLGPFLAKNFATTRVALGGDAGGARAVPRAARDRVRRSDPAPLPYLDDADDRARRRDRHRARGVARLSGRCASRGSHPCVSTRSRFADLYWTPAQLLDASRIRRV